MSSNVHPGMSPHEAAGFYASMVEKVRDYCIFLITPDGLIATWNDSAAEMKGFRADDAIGHHFRMLYTAASQAAGEPERNLREAVERGTRREEAWRRKKDGSVFWALTELIALVDDRGSLCGFCKITADLSERHALQAALRREKHMAELTLRAIADAVISVDESGRVKLINAQAETLTGWSEAAAHGRPLAEVLGLVDDASLARLRDEPGRWIHGEQPFSATAPATLESRDGTRYLIQGSFAAASSASGHAEGGVIVFRDVTAEHAHVRRLAHEATHDPLTGLVNRAEFERRLEQVFTRSAAGQWVGALLYLDLDGFKAVNDSAGHVAGDRLLQALGRCYRGEVRTSDTLARIGGDEFALIVENSTAEGAYAVATNLLQATRGVAVGDSRLNLTVGVSIGIALLDCHTTSIQDLLHAADRACYLAKAKGRGRIEFADRTSGSAAGPWMPDRPA